MLLRQGQTKDKPNEAHVNGQSCLQTGRGASSQLGLKNLELFKKSSFSLLIVNECMVIAAVIRACSAERARLSIMNKSRVRSESDMEYCGLGA